MLDNKSQSIAIIPARLKSTRFPEKVLVKIQEKTLLEHTYENIKKAQIFDQIWIATDHKKILTHAKNFCDQVYMTSENCKNGTERIIDLLKDKPHVSEEQIIFNVQADHPTISSDTFTAIKSLLIKDPLSLVATACCPIFKKKVFLSPHIVKCVLDCYNNALYFSRAPIPYTKKLPYSCYQHLGIYAFRKKFLDIYENFTTTPLSQAEDLEQLRILEYGYKIKVAIVEDNPIGIDIPQDLTHFKNLLNKKITQKK